MRHATPALPCAALAAALLAACSSAPPRSAPETGPYQAPTRAETAPIVESAPRRGGYYKDDGPGDNAPANLELIPDAQPRREPLHRFANNPYQVFGTDYVPRRTLEPFSQRGMGSWYGRRYHGQATSSGEPYDMYAMTAAHPTLPIPSYVRVTNLTNNRSVVVRINDRGPFLAGRVIDLSFVAAHRLGYAHAGSALVEVEAVLPDATAGTQLAQATPVASPAVAQKPAAQKPAPQKPAAPAGAPAREPAPVVQKPAPVAAAPAAEEATRLPVSADARGVYLQLGAFSVRDNAESFRARVYKELAWLNDAISVFARDGLFRLHVGPYRTQEEARVIAERIRSDLNLKPVLLVR